MHSWFWVIVKIEKKFFFLLILFLSFLYTFEKVEAKKLRIRIQKGIVKIEGAMVYKKSNFDSPVIGFLKKGEKVVISQKIFGAFYMVKLKKGIWGYISDVDVQTSANAGNFQNKNNRKIASEENKEKDSHKNDNRPFWQSRYIGLMGGMANFAEDTMGDEYSESLIMLGLHYFGSSKVFSDAIIDVSFTGSYAPPTYYVDVTGNTVEGFLLLSDVCFIFPLKVSSGKIVYYGMGPFISMTNFDIIVNGQNLSLQELNLGAVFNFGIGLKISRFAIRGEVKYFVEKKKYLGYFASLQMKF